MKKGNSIVGGFIILIVGICLLWWNEGNNVKNIESVNEGMKNYIDIDSSKVDTKNDGKLVATHGDLVVTGEISDDVFGVTSSSAALLRNVEMYQWVEDCDSDDKNCTYTTEWKDYVVDSSGFKEAGHSNPENMLYETETFTSSNATIGSFTLPDKLVNSLSTKHKITNLPETVAGNDSFTLSNNYYTNVRDGKAEVGNIRVSFFDNDAKVVSVLAEQSGNTFKVYKTKKGKDLFRIFEDNYDGNDMLTIISKQNNFMKWLFRIVGILAVIGGIGSLFSPITNLVGRIPILGGIVNGATGVVSFVLGLAISLVVIAIAWFRFRPLLSIILIIIVGALILGLKTYSNKHPKEEKNA